MVGYNVESSFGTISPSSPSHPEVPPFDLGPRNCWKILTFSGKYKQELVRVSSNGYKTFDLVMTDLVFTWDCVCLTDEEAVGRCKEHKTELVPLEGAGAYPAGENYWQTRTFSTVLKCEKTSKRCTRIITTEDTDACSGGYSRRAKDTKHRLPGMCEGENCTDRHTPQGLLSRLLPPSLQFRCTCAGRIRSVARDLMASGDGKGIDDPSSFDCEGGGVYV